MFGFLKKKFSDVVESLTKKKEEEEKFGEKVEKIEEEVEQQPERIEKEPGKVVEEIKEAVKEENPAVKAYIEQELKQVQEEAKEKPKEEKVSLFKKVIKKITERRLSEEDVNPVLNELENGLIEGDVAYEVAEKVKNDLKVSLLGMEAKHSEVKPVIVSRLRNSLMEILNVPDIDLKEVIKKARSENRPAVLLFLGFNGSGKTTSLAKVGKWLLNQNYSCAFAAADTWRSAAIEQLEEHGKKLSVIVVKHQYGADPAAVIYDGISSAKAKGVNVLLADSAGRSHTNKDLMDELSKIVRVNKPDLKILVLDGLSGSDVLPQFEFFNDGVGVDAIIFSKMDVNEKGGNLLSVCHLSKKPILFLGTGQNYQDLKHYDREEIVKNLVES